MQTVKEVAKAVIGALIAFVSSLVVVMVGSVGFGDITDGQWLAAVLAGLIAFGGVYGVPNAKPTE